MGDKRSQGLSVSIITKNEARHIDACLTSVAGLADEVVVVDSGSTDGTQALCRAHGARVIEAAWQGFGPQKNLALAQAREPWVLSLDADERVPPDLYALIKAVLGGAPGMPGSGALPPNGYAVDRCSQFCGKWVHHCGWRPGYVLRLFRRAAGRFSDDPVHERVLVEGPVGRLDPALLHYSYLDAEDVERKTRQYASAGAAALSRRGRPVAATAPWMHGAFAWFRTLILHAGFLDGMTGFAVARMNARVSFLKYRLARAAHRSARQSAE